MQKRIWIFIIVFFVVGAAAGWIGARLIAPPSQPDGQQLLETVQIVPDAGSNSAASPQSPQSTPGIPVRVAAVGKRDISLNLDAQGTLVPKLDVKIAPKVTGRVQSLFVDVGDTIEAGQVLLQLEDDELLIAEQQSLAAVAAAQANVARLKLGARTQEIELAKAQLAQAQANLTQAESQYARILALYETGSIPESQLEQVRAQRDVAAAGVDAAQSQLDLVLQGPLPEDIQAAEANLRQAEAALAMTQLQVANAQVTSPVSGIIASKMVEPGDFASAGVPVFRVVQVDPIVLRIEVGGRDVVRLKPGMTTRLYVDAFPGQSFEGQISLVESVADPATRLFGVRIETPNPDGLLRSGMAARVQVLLDQARDVVAVPDTALVAERDETSVFVVSGDYVVRRPVTIGLVANGYAEITSGLSVGEEIVVSGQNFITDGSKIQIVERVAP